MGEKPRKETGSNTMTAGTFTYPTPSTKEQIREAEERLKALKEQAAKEASEQKKAKQEAMQAAKLKVAELDGIVTDLLAMCYEYRKQTSMKAKLEFKLEERTQNILRM